MKNIKPEKKNASIYEHAGDIYSMLGKTENALEMWRKAKSLGTDSKILEKKIRQKKYIAQ